MTKVTKNPYRKELTAAPIAFVSVCFGMVTALTMVQALSLAGTSYPAWILFPTGVILGGLYSWAYALLLQLCLCYQAYKHATTFPTSPD